MQLYRSIHLEVVFGVRRRHAIQLMHHFASKNPNLRSSIAVLGFKNMSSNRDSDWLSTAITQMLSTELANG
jgi:TolB-like protein